jgi:chemotaxis protein CheD
MRIIDVSTGEICFITGDVILESNGIGSCICLAVYDCITHCGGIAHIMLPGRAPESAIKDGSQFRYAQNAIDSLLLGLSGLKADIQKLRVFVAGGGNVLNLPDETVCENNINSVRNILAQYKLKPVVEFTGGTIRRRIRLDLNTGRFYCAEGDGEEMAVE